MKKGKVRVFRQVSMFIPNFLAVRRRRTWAAMGLVALALASACDALAQETRLLNDGQLVLQDVPPIPATLPGILDRFQQVSPHSLVEWAHDSQAVYVRARVDGVNQLLIAEGDGKEPRPLTSLDEPVREVRRQHNGRLIAFTSDTGGSGFDQIYILDPADGSVRLLTDGESLNNRHIWDQSGARIAWRSTRRNGRSNDLWIMDVDRPDSARMIHEAKNGALWKPVAFTRDGRRLVVQEYRGITDSRIHLLELDTGRMRELVGHPEYETSNVAIGFDHLDEGMFFVSNLRGRAAEIGWVPLAEGEEIRFVPNTIAWDVNEFEISADGKRGAFVTNEDGISRLYLFDARRFKYKPVRNMPIGVITDLRFSPDGKHLGMTLNTPKGPSDAFSLKLGWFALSGSRLKRWTQGSVGGLDTESFVVPQLFRYPAPGLTPDSQFNIPGFIYLPEGEGPHPVVIWVHGGPESQYRPSFNATVQMWVTELGLAVVAPNIRGSLGYGKTYLSLDDGMAREDAVRDIGALLDWIDTVPMLDASRVAVFGASYGGYMALASAVHYSDRLAAAVDRAGISNFVTYLENTQDYRRDLRRFEYGDERDPEMRAFLESISPLNNVERIDIPLLIVQGQNDPVVPVTESEQMVLALRERGQTVWYLNALNEGHGYEKRENRDVFQQVTFMFLQRFLLDQSAR